MILFIGSSDRGFFAEEIAVKKGRNLLMLIPIYISGRRCR